MLSHVSNAYDCFENAKNMPFEDGNFDNLRRQRAFFVAGIVAYGRCFAQAGSGIPTLDAKAVYKVQPDLMKIHARLVGPRNTFAAHADQSDIVRVTLAVRESQNKVEVRNLITTTFPGDEVAGHFRALHAIELFSRRKVDRLVARLEKQTGKVIELDTHQE